MNPILAKTIATTILLAATTAHVSADTVILQQWEFDEVLGTQLDQCANSGTIGTAYPWTSSTEFATDGAGNLEVKAETNAWKASNSFTALSGTDTYSFEIKLGEWDIPDANTVRARLLWKLGGIEIQTLLDPDEGLGFTLISAGTNYRTHWIGEWSGTTATARIDFNVTDGTATYFVDGDEKESFTGQTLGTMDSFVMQKDGFDVADAATVLKIDEETLSVFQKDPNTLQQWQYGESAGTTIGNVANTGTLNSAWANASINEFATDGAGNLDIVVGSGGYKTTSAATALDSTETYSLEIKVAEWNIPAANTDPAKLQFRMNANPNVVEIQTLLDPSNGLGFTLVSAGTNYRTHWVGGASGTVATARVDFNLADGTATYFVNDVEMDSFTGLTFDPMESFLMQKGGFDTADAATVLKIDEQTLSVASSELGPLTIELVGDDAELTWDGAGVLQSDDDLQGIWTDVDGGAATSPYTVTGPLTGKEFYRLRP